MRRWVGTLEGVDVSARNVTYVRRPDGGAVAVELAGDTSGAPVLVCHGLADSGRCARLLDTVGRAVGAFVVAPDRPGVGLSDMRSLERLSDWAEDVALVLDALGLDRAGVLGISGGGPFAAACAAALAERVRGLVLVSSLGQAGWGSGGMAAGERFALALATRRPSFGGWFLERLALVARRSPRLFFEIATVELPEVDRRALQRVEQRQAFIEGYMEAFRRGRAGVTQDLQLLTRRWDVDLDAVRAPTYVHHGDADTTVPPEHAQQFADAIPGACLRLHPGHGHFSLLADAADELLANLV
jgi:pimeloyl-ACP methyl ester carboxylesterase